MRNVYKYKSLPEGDYTRVLILAPGKGDIPLFGVLEVIRLRKKRTTHPAVGRKHETSSKANVTRLTPDIPYEAVSYVWGSDEKDHIIFLSGRTHQITANLSAALHQCRLRNRPRVLWADSVCIDQEEIGERNHQVYMMSRIYASAQRTLICLGTNLDHRNYAQEASILISDTNEMIQEVFEGHDLSRGIDNFPWPASNDPLVTDSRWRSIHKLLLNPWFRRGWIVQEVALAREARILWTGYSISLLDLIRADLWHKRRVDMCPLTGDIPNRTARTPSLLKSFFSFARYEEAEALFIYGLKPEELSILAALHSARELGLSDPRDRIYAFMALPFVENTVSVRPNYNQSHVEIYQDFAIKYLEETLDLNILRYATPMGVRGVSAESRRIGSWVPRWDHKFNVVHGTSNLKFGQKSTAADDFVILHGGNGVPALLQVRAVIFDSVELVSRHLNSSLTIMDAAKIWSQLTKQADSASRQDEDSSVCAFVMALEYGCNFPMGAEREQIRATARKSYMSLLKTNGQIAGSQRSPQIPRDILFFHDRLMNEVTESHSFALERGNLGRGPCGIRQGDICAFVFGVRSPLILREFPHGGAGHYHVLGPAFVTSMSLCNTHGLAEGLNRRVEWENWDRLCKRERWTDLGLKEERIVLH